MDFIQLREKLKNKQCPRWSERQRTLHAYDSVLRHTYNELLSDLKAFDDRYTVAAGVKTYTPLSQRRSAMEYHLPATITRDLIALLFSESRFPMLQFESEEDSTAATQVIKALGLDALMFDLAIDASIGSAALVPEVFEVAPGRFQAFPAIWPSYECEPIFERFHPGKLAQITRTWDVPREALVADGYDVDALETEWTLKLAKGSIAPDTKRIQFDWWYCRRRLTKGRGIWYYPVPKKVYEQAGWDEWVEDVATAAQPGRSVDHKLDLCPAFWIAPRAKTGAIDATPLFKGAVDNALVIERTMSVGAQAIATAGQPILAVSRKGGGETGLRNNVPDGGDGHPVIEGRPLDVTPESILEVDEVGGAWLVEQGAGATTALDAFIARARGLSVENCAGSRVSEETVAGAKSGYAMELLNQAMTNAAGTLRPYYSSLLVEIVHTMSEIHEKMPLIGIDRGVPRTSPATGVQWGAYYEPSGPDKLADVNAATKALTNGGISEETYVANVAPLFDVTDINAERKKIAQERLAREKAAAALAAAAKPTACDDPSPGAVPSMTPAPAAAGA